MPRILDQARYKCGLGGMQTVHAITKALPILHSGPGCADKLEGAGSAGTSGHFAPRIFPCTNISESEVVFGGERKLRETIENALRVIDADLYVVLSGCSAEIIGDDIEAVVREFREGDKPVIYASTAGFKGNNYLGYEWVLEAIFKQYLKKEAVYGVETGLVNIFAGLPIHDPFWHGNYEVLSELLKELGLKPNIIFGFGNGIENIKQLPKAEFNLLVSPWLGLSSVELLKELFGTPFLHYPNLPIGAYETSKFLKAVGDFAGIDPKKTAALIDEKERKYYYYIERYADVFLENRVMSKRFVVVSDAQYTLGITRFLINDVGLFPEKQYITDDTPEPYKKNIEDLFQDLNYGIKAEVSFETDGYQIQEEIKNTDYHGYPLLIGSSWEKKVARETEAHFLSISWPLNERLVINSSYAGYEGGLKFLEDIYSVVLTRFN